MSRREKAATLSTESILSSEPDLDRDVGSCPRCAAPVAGDQRYCLECGERQVPVSGLHRAAPEPTGTPPPLVPPEFGPPGGEERARSNPALTLIAGVGVLLLAMGVGVLIGRAGGSGSAAPAPQVLSIPSASAPLTSGAEASTFVDDWPSGTSGFTVKLQTLPQSGSTKGTIEAAKTAAEGKGATNVGALLTEHFSSLTVGSYIIYSGVFHKRSEAEKALTGLSRTFPGASVVAVNNASSGQSSAGGAGSAAAGAGSSESKPASGAVLKGLKNAKGKSYEEKSKALPDVIETP